VKTNGINVTHSRDVVVTNNTCMDNPYGGIQVSSSSHVLVAGNICTGNDHGIGLGTNDVVIDPGHHMIGINHCYDNAGKDVQTEPFNGAYLMTGNRWYGLGGSALPEGSVLADPGTLYEQHDDGTGALYVKESGVNTATGWRRVNGGVGPQG
jgi:parallel beta-helix repeat protein